METVLKKKHPTADKAKWSSVDKLRVVCPVCAHVHVWYEWQITTHIGIDYAEYLLNPTIERHYKCDNCKKMFLIKSYSSKVETSLTTNH